MAFNELIYTFDARGSDFSGGGHHDSIEELNMGLELVAVSIALPVEIHHHLSLHHGRDQVFVVLDGLIQLIHFVLSLRSSSFGHQDLKDMSQPFLDLSLLEILAESVEAVPLSLELSRGVDFVSHDPRDGLLHVLHPLDHLEVTHIVHLLDKGVVLLPECHLEAGLNPLSLLNKTPFDRPSGLTS